MVFNAILEVGNPIWYRALKWKPYWDLMAVLPKYRQAQSCFHYQYARTTILLSWTTFRRVRVRYGFFLGVSANSPL